MKHFWWLIPILKIGIVPLSLCATVNDPLRVAVMTGYQNEQLHWHLQDPGGAGLLTYSEQYPSSNFWNNQLVLKTIYRDLVLYLQGGYAAFGNGTVRQTFTNLSYATDSPQLTFSSNGWSADAFGYVGYAANLTSGRTYQLLVIPLVGFSAFFETLHRQGSPTWRSEQAVGATSYQLRSSYPKPLTQTWYGFLLGAALRIAPGGRFLMDLGYAYNWLHLDFKAGWSQSLQLYENSTILSQSDTTCAIKSKSSGNLGQAGWVVLDWWLDQAWRAGLAGQIRYFTSTVLSVDEERNGIDVPQKLKVRWTPITISVTISRSF